ncbi:hypothetical protein N2152v2_000030 [Parachlorella kessleri]
MSPSPQAPCGQGAASVEFFTGKKMTVYQKIVQGEFHDHALIAKLLYGLLCQHFKPTRKLRLLDLGCGDASFAASILTQGTSAGDTPLSLSSYTGVDLSATSLQLAAQQPLPLPAGNGSSSSSRRLVEQDMLGFLRAWQDGQQAQQEEGQQQVQLGGHQQHNNDKPQVPGEALPAGSPGTTASASATHSKDSLKSPSDPDTSDRPYDIILCALSVHHLPQHAKRELLRRARCALAPGGCLLLMDVFRKEGESREAYMERARDYFFGEEARSVLSPAESQEVWAHVTVFDYPEAESDYHQMSAEAGFARCQLVHSCRREWTKVVALWRD